MNSYDLEGRVAVVTGGANGIGQAIAARFRTSGAQVAIWDMDAENVAQSEVESFFACDISHWESVREARDATRDALGRIDIVVNSAGIAGPNAPVEDYDIAAWRQIMEVNLTGTFLVNRAVVPGMKEKGYGRIVNIASVAGKEGNPQASAYSASKAGVIALTKSLGKELADHNIAVNCVTPAAARTRIFDQMSEEHIQYMLSKIPRARFVDVEEIAAMVTWLCSEENSFTTASVFDLSGGRATY
ncbi:SDR family NAD(P)-dependent oxidoreductase [Ruegeria arenilitoris]|uniref:SDR family NAD(P)-dependent oxidoreductase n=1 Tax=Ruegeria arenilitoris TaxID=1173585 RepID=UPI00147BFDBB|nr:SDR family NAD(P)-dependent oxidoreductase [Ruegeria arenilitoris]